MVAVPGNPLGSWGQDEGRIALRVNFLREVTSTNDEIKRAIDAGEPEGLSVMAFKQTAGYGRQGRTWESPVGGLYQSFLMRPQVAAVQLPTLSLVMGMAVCNAARAVLPEVSANQVMVKWPNDVVLMAGGADGVDGAVGADGPRGSDSAPAQAPSAFQKVAGISLERYKSAVCVGIGVNVARPGNGNAAADAKNRAVYLDELGLRSGSVESRVQAMSNVLAEKVWALYGQWLREGFAAFSQPFNARYNALMGRFVSMEDINGCPLASGQVERVSEQGELVLLDAQGHECCVSSGEAHITG